MDKILKEVLQVIKPTEKEINSMNDVSNFILKKIKIPYAIPFLGGSGAKNTWLKNSHDIDIYIRFSKNKYAGKDISKILKKHLEKKFKISTLHGSRDYYQATINDFTIEFIPLFNINKATEADNITDISPLHTAYVNKYKKYDDIRLFKAFCKANNVYGAESYIQGLSGYVCEILIINYGSFKNSIKNISKWKARTEIGNKSKIKELNSEKVQSPLVLLDPVDHFRNAAAAISKEKYELLRSACKSFVRKPSKSLFVKQEINLEYINKKYHNKKVLQYKIIPLDAKKDVAGAKLRRGVEYLEAKLKEQEFEVEKTYWNFDKTSDLFLVMNPKTLHYLKKHLGPPKENKAAIEAFKKKWKDYHVSSNSKRVFVEIPRKFQLPEELITHIIRSDKVLKQFMKTIRTA